MKMRLFLKQMMKTNNKIIYKLMIDNLKESRYNKVRHFGEVAQLARACGSYPQCRRFKSVLRYYRFRELYFTTLFFVKFPRYRLCSYRCFENVIIFRDDFAVQSRQSCPCYRGQDHQAHTSQLSSLGEQ